jgi:hypothetical protein
MQAGNNTPIGLSPSVSQRPRGVFVVVLVTARRGGSSVFHDYGIAKSFRDEIYTVLHIFRHVGNEFGFWKRKVMHGTYHTRIVDQHDAQL